jgi:hypothetical protein
MGVSTDLKANYHLHYGSVIMESVAALDTYHNFWLVSSLVFTDVSVGLVKFWGLLIAVLVEKKIQQIC